MTGSGRIWIDADGLHLEVSEHGFELAQITDGVHAAKCQDQLCDGCVALNECAICKRPEFEHGDGDE